MEGLGGSTVAAKMQGRLATPLGTSLNESCLCEANALLTSTYPPEGSARSLGPLCGQGDLQAQADPMAPTDPMKGRVG